MSVADQLEERGHQKGLQVGLQKTLLKLLGLRFGALPEAVVAQVSAASAERLDVWLERVISAPTLADVLNDATASAG